MSQINYFYLSLCDTLRNQKRKENNRIKNRPLIKKDGLYKEHRYSMNI